MGDPITVRAFISYRREDTAGYAGPLYDALAARMSAADVFMDVSDIEPGVDFSVAIDDAVGSCDVMLALIGPRWATAVTADGSRRLDDPDDYVVVETAVALPRPSARQRWIREDPDAGVGSPAVVSCFHADRGSPMTAKPVALLPADLDVTRSHSRPHVSNDNSYSESQFRTVKYRPSFADRFGCFEDAQAHCRQFFGWYNDEHRYSGIGFHTAPISTAAEPRPSASSVPSPSMPPTPNTPNCFVRKPPALPAALWINKPRRTPQRHNDFRRNVSQKG